MKLKISDNSTDQGINEKVKDSSKQNVPEHRLSSTCTIKHGIKGRKSKSNSRADRTVTDQRIDLMTRDYNRLEAGAIPPDSVPFPFNKSRTPLSKHHSP